MTECRLAHSYKRIIKKEIFRGTRRQLRLHGRRGLPRSPVEGGLGASMSGSRLSDGQPHGRWRSIGKRSAVTGDLRALTRATNIEWIPTRADVAILTPGGAVVAARRWRCNQRGREVATLDIERMASGVGPG